jgi:lauroyl/myristoyl acyltransferase
MAGGENPVRDFFTYAIYRLLGSLVGHMPPRVGYRVTVWMGRLLYALSPRLRGILAGNIRQVTGPDISESQLEALVQEACINNVKGHYDLFRVGRLTAEDIEELTHVEGWDNLEESLALGRGVVVFSAHLGNVDVVMQLAVIRGIPAAAPVQRIRPERLFRYTMGLRTSHGLRLIPTGEPMIGLLRMLKQGGLVGLAADRDVADGARTVDFFGSPARLPDGPVRLALRTGAPLVPAFALRLPDNSFRVRIEPRLELPQTGDHEADVGAGMELVVRAMERHIGPQPEQWLVAQPVWSAQ